VPCRPTSTGLVATVVPVPTPSWPLALSPQAHTERSARIGDHLAVLGSTATLEDLADGPGQRDPNRHRALGGGAVAELATALPPVAVGTVAEGRSRVLPRRGERRRPRPAGQSDLCVPRMPSIGCELHFDGWTRARRASGTVTLSFLYRAIYGVLQLIQLIGRSDTDLAIEVGAAPRGGGALLAIRGHGDPRGPTIGEVADYLLLRHRSTVGLVDRADIAGLVT